MSTLEVLKERLAFLEKLQNPSGLILHASNENAEGCVFYLEKETMFSKEETKVYNQICADAVVKMINTIKFNIRAEIHAIETGL